MRQAVEYPSWDLYEQPHILYRSNAILAGQEGQHLEEKPKSDSSHANAASNSKRKNRSEASDKKDKLRSKAVIDPKSKKPVCFNFNKDHSCSKNPCKYSHVCQKCFGAEHNALKCNK